jgi:hypothetical protein
MRGIAQGIDNLKRRGLLPFETIGIDRVDDGNPGFGCQFTHQLQALVKIAVEGNYDRAVNESLGQLAHRNLSRRQEDSALNACPRSISGGGCGGVTRGCTNDQARTQFGSFAHCDSHPAVFEGPSRIQPLVLEVNPAATAENRAQARRIN